jgi:hypothetical protein
MCWDECFAGDRGCLVIYHMVSQDNIKCIHETFQRSPHKTVCQASLELGLLHSTVDDVLHKNLKLYSYRLQMVQKITCIAQDLRKRFTLEMLPHIEEDETYFKRICFSNEATFCVRGKSTGIIAVYR